MKHIIEKWEGRVTGSALWNFYFRDIDVGVLDIETTGLNPSLNKFILGGLFDVKAGRLHQVLAESRTEEKATLAAFLELTEKMDVIVTYNGRHFDVPFLETRRKRLMPEVFTPGDSGCSLPYNLDIYQILKGYSQLRRILPNLKQKTVESYMGLWETRADEISGSESAEIYNHYENTGSREDEEKILLHNNDDVRQLTRLTEAVTKSDFHRAMNCLGFPVKAGGHLLEIAKAGPTGDTFRVSGRQLRNPVNYIAFRLGSTPAEIRFQQEEFLIEVPLLKHHGLGIVDLEQLEIGVQGTLDRYPLCREGFLVVREGTELKYREINDLAITLIKAFCDREV
ncbi:MAG: ribonuclease H-like domain-containing protein [Lentihominibacter sp.]